MRQFILLVGNNGTGKTFYSKNHFPSDFLIVRPDDFHGDLESKQSKMIKQIETKLANNESVVLDGLNLEREQRIQLLYFAKKYSDCKKIIYDFGPGNQKILEILSRERPYYSYEEWSKIFYNNFKLYQKPTMDEGYDEIIEINNNFA